MNDTAHPLRSRTILAVDDDADARALLERLLTSQGAKVLTESSVERAIATARVHPPDLLLTDLHMPEQGGFVLLEHKKNIPALAPVPTIVVSSQSDSDSLRQAMALGAVDYVVKPIDPLRLLRKIHRALRHRTFGTHTFAPESRPVARVGIEAQLLTLSEAELTIETEAKLAPDSNITFDSKLIRDLSLDQKILRSCAEAPRFSTQVRRHLSQIVIVGVTEELRARIRSWICSGICSGKGGRT